MDILLAGFAGAVLGYLLGEYIGTIRERLRQVQREEEACKAELEQSQPSDNVVPIHPPSRRIH